MSTNMNAKSGALPVIKSAVLRLQRGNLIVPMSLLAELVSVEALESSENPGIHGWLNWRNRNVPVVSLESLCMMEGGAMPSTESKCLILHTVASDGGLPFIGIQVQGGMQTVDIHESTLRDDYSGNVERCPYVARQVRISHLLCLIPDLPAIEASVAELITVSV